MVSRYLLLQFKLQAQCKHIWNVKARSLFTVMYVTKLSITVMCLTKPFILVPPRASYNGNDCLLNRKSKPCNE